MNVSVKGEDGGSRMATVLYAVGMPNQYVEVRSCGRRPPRCFTSTTNLPPKRERYYKVIGPLYYGRVEQRYRTVIKTLTVKTVRGGKIIACFKGYKFRKLTGITVGEGAIMQLSPEHIKALGLEQPRGQSDQAEAATEAADSSTVEASAETDRAQEAASD